MRLFKLVECAQPVAIGFLALVGFVRVVQQ